MGVDRTMQHAVLPPCKMLEFSVNPKRNRDERKSFECFLSCFVSFCFEHFFYFPSIFIAIRVSKNWELNMYKKLKIINNYIVVCVCVCVCAGNSSECDFPVKIPVGLLRMRNAIFHKHQLIYPLETIIIFSIEFTISPNISSYPTNNCNWTIGVIARVYHRFPVNRSMTANWSYVEQMIPVRIGKKLTHVSMSHIAKLI